MTRTLLGFTAGHPAAAAFAWGLFKALFPFPTPSFFLLAGAELARVGTDAGAKAAFLVVLGRLALPGALGGVLGATPYYFWARRGGWPLAGRWAPWLGIRRSRLKAWEKRWTERKGKLTFVLGVASMASLLLGAILAGLGEASPWEYAGWAFLGGAARALALGLAGWKLRDYGDPAELFHPGRLALGALLIVAAVVLAVRGRARDADSSPK